MPARVSVPATVRLTLEFYPLLVPTRSVPPHTMYHVFPNTLFSFFAF